VSADSGVLLLKLEIEFNRDFFIDYQISEL